MKWILSLLLCFSASAQLPVVPFNPSTSSRWLPNQAANTLFYWYELTPTNSARVNFDGSGSPPTDTQSPRSWINLAHNNDVAGYASGGTVPQYFVSGGGNNGTSPRLNFPSTAGGTGYVSPAVTTVFTNFTFMIVLKMTSTTGNQSIISSGNAIPRLTISSGVLTMDAGSTTAGPVSIGTTPMIITWNNCNATGANSEIYTNGVLYKSGASGSVGFFANAGPYIGHNIVNILQADVCRVWCWTNNGSGNGGTLSASDMTKALNQCKSDFGFP